ncbi:ABC transporter permease [Oceanicella actignis]|uniref:ABC transporter permease n=1 Tax=Oceanicella actignis TaxID=1189325 RepID=UPI0011E6DA73|nr:iron ABC transporter permease [Oceanicella actignis]TYO84985.1 iron(III) transport system permease protein [Oceanicella actignis]
MTENFDLEKPRRALPAIDGWTVASLALGLALAMPLISVAAMALFPSENIWPHLLATVLPRYVGNSLILMAAVGAGTAMIGVGAAWLVVMKRFPLRGVLEWALLAPLAMPAYIGAYALVDFLEYAGPVQTALRAAFGWSSARDYWFPEIRSLGSACAVFTLTLYPYVYLMARAAFREQSVCALEVSRSLGCGPWGSFFRVALPLARPAVAAGAAIAMMETLNDFGAVDYFAVQTLTTGVFSVWLESHNAGGAAQISSVTLIFVLALLGLESASRRGRRYHNMSRRYRPIEGEELGPVWRWIATLACLTPVTLGFLLPAGIMADHALTETQAWRDPDLWRAAANTAMLAGAAAAVSCAAGVTLVYGARVSRSGAPRMVARLAALGYAAPGAVLAVGILFPFAAIDDALADAALALTGHDPGLLLTGSAAALVFAYVVRFAAIAYGSIDSAFGRVTPSMEAAARALGETRAGALKRVHLPLIRGSVLTAALLIFVDSAKELPATLLLRPFNFETLATAVYNAASLEDIGGAAPPALAIVLVGLAPVALLMRSLRHSRPGEQPGR